MGRANPTEATVSKRPMVSPARMAMEAMRRMLSRSRLPQYWAMRISMAADRPLIIMDRKVCTWVPI